MTNWTPEYTRQYHRDYYAKTRTRRSSPENWPRHALGLVRRRARKLEVEFNLTVEDLTLPEICPVLGLKLVAGQGRGIANHPNTPTVDRIDNSKGYVKGNVRVISYRANILKRDASLEELQNIVAYVKRELDDF